MVNNGKLRVVNMGVMVYGVGRLLVGIIHRKFEIWTKQKTKRKLISDTLYICLCQLGQKITRTQDADLGRVLMVSLEPRRREMSPTGTRSKICSCELSHFQLRFNGMWDLFGPRFRRCCIIENFQQRSCNAPL